MCYLGITSNCNAKFIEGYRVLSLNTRDRFLGRGDIGWSESGEYEGSVSEGVRSQGRVD